MPESLQQMFYRRLDETPAGRALAWYSSSGEFSWMTFEELMARASGPAACLAAEGVRAGDVCIIVLPSEERASLLLLAVFQLGAVPLLVAPPLLRGTDETLLQTLRHTIRRTQARVVILPLALSGLVGRLPGKGTRRYLFGERVVQFAGASEPPRVNPAEGDVVAMQLTSGTTGRPRICVWSQRNVLAGLAGMHAAMGLSSEDVCFNWTPLYHDMGLVNNFLLCLTHRVPLIMMKPFDFVKHPALWVRGLTATGLTVTWSPNFGFVLAAERVTEDELSGVRLDRVRAFWNAAERIHVETMRAFHARYARYGVGLEALRTNFGCAENVGGATFTAVGETFPVEVVHRDSLLQRRVARTIGSANGDGQGAVAVVGVGRPYPGMRIHILSSRGKPLPDGHVGEIALDTPSRMMGYRGDAAANRRAFLRGLLRTGDLGYVRGQELFWVGRVKERITVRGRKLDPSDFEPVLLRIPGLRQGSFAAFGVEDAVRGTQRVIIVAEVRDPPGRSGAEIIGDISRGVFLHLGLTADEVLLVRPGTLTKTSSGKRRHRFFRRQYLSGGLGAFLFEERRVGQP